MLISAIDLALALAATDPADGSAVAAPRESAFEEPDLETSRDPGGDAAAPAPSEPTLEEPDLEMLRDLDMFLLFELLRHFDLFADEADTENDE